MRNPLLIALGLLLAACSSELPHDAPFDPSSDPARQARATLSGQVTLAGESSFSGVDVQLQNTAHTYAVATGDDGSYSLTGLVPGTYRLRISTRYFEQLDDTVAVQLGESKELPAIELAAKTSAVRGNALAESLSGQSIVKLGGVLVRLVKTGSIRGAKTAPYARFAAEETGPVISGLSGSDGSFTFSEVPAGTYSATAEADGVSLSLGDVTVTGEEDVALDAAVVPRLTGFFDIVGTADGLENRSLTASGTVKLRLTAFHATHMRIANPASEDPAACAAAPLQAYAAEVPAYSLARQGDNVICVQFTDDGGAATEMLYGHILYDGTPPVITSLALAAGASAVVDVTGLTTLTLAALDTTGAVAQVKLANLGNGQTCAQAIAGVTAEAYVAARSWYLASPGAGLEGSRTVCAAARDTAGNWSAPVSDTVSYDTLAPQAAAPVVRIDGGALFTADTQVVLTLQATGASWMMLANDGVFGGAQWEPYRSQAAWFLPAIQGVRSVWAKFKDDAGNETGTYAAYVTYDSQAPSVPSIAIVNAAGYVTSTTVQVNLSATGATKMQLSDDGFFDAETTETYATTKSWTFGAGDGARFLYARFLDDAGNASAVVGASVILDTAAPLPGAVVLNGGDPWSNTRTVGITLSATDAYETALVADACPAPGTWSAYAAATSLQLPNVQGVHYVYARFRDRAGNTTGCVSSPVNLDTVTPGFSASVTGTETIAGRTRRQIVYVNVSSPATDVTQMQISTESNFAGAAWGTFLPSTQWVLTPGDGVKTLYIRVRDAARNQAAGLTRTITLDQTGPEAPNLALADIDLDGFSVGAGDVELRWSEPSDPQLQGYEVQRFVQNVDSGFVTLGAFGPGTTTLADDVTLTTGNAHLYRIRAFDDLGNESSWSLAVSALPFQGLDQAYRIASTTGNKYFFKPYAGTFSLVPAYAYQDATGTTYSESLVYGSTSWVRTQASSEVLNEELHIRTSNQDNSLVQDSVIPLRVNERLVLDAGGNNGLTTSIKVDSKGYLHVADMGNFELYYLTNKSGAWVEEATYLGACCQYNVSLALDAQDHPRIAYTTPSPGKLWYREFNGATWSEVQLDVTTAVGTHVSLAMYNGDPRIAYRDETNGNLRYASRTGGVWTYQTVDAADDTGFYPSLAVDAAGAPHIAYYDATSQALLYTTFSGTWSSTMIASVGYWDWSGGRVSLALDSAGKVGVTYYDWVSNALTYASNAGGSFQPVMVDTTGQPGKFTALAYDARDVPYIAYFEAGSKDLKFASRKTGTWTLGTVARSPDVGEQVSLAVDSQGDAHITYQNTTGLDLEYAKVDGGVVRRSIVTAGDVGSYLALAAATDGTLHGVYYDATNGDLVYTNMAGQTTTIDSGGDVGLYPSIAADVTGVVHVAYYDATNGGLKYARRYHGVWSKRFVDNDANVGEWPAIAVDSLGRVNITYGDQTVNDRKLKFARRTTAGNWNTEVVASGLSTYPNPVQSTLALDATGGVFVYCYEAGGLYHRNGPSNWSVDTSMTFADANMVMDAQGFFHVSSRRAYDNALLYTSNRTGAWVEEVVDTGASFGTVSRIRLDAAGKAHIVYYDDTNGNLKYATNAPGVWATAAIDETGNVGKRIGLAMDSLERLHALYYDQTNADVKYITEFHGWLPASSVVRTTAF